MSTFLSRANLPSSLFPYTTLFRSTDSSSAFLEPGHHGRDLRLPAERIADALQRRGERSRRIRAQRRVPDLAAVDRKSTRLNSSYLVISYAVFCLKKKDFLY